MLRLVDVTDDGAWIRRRVQIDDMPSELAPAIDALVDARLVARADDEVDVVHEVVFRAWPQLVAWLEEARADLTLERDLRAAARSWDAAGSLRRRRAPWRPARRPRPTGLRDAATSHRWSAN